VLRNDEFGYTKVVIERPLRVRYESTVAARAALSASKALAKLTPEARDAMFDAADDDGDWATSSLSEAEARIEDWASKSGKSTKATRDALLAGVTCLTLRAIQ